MSRRGTEFGESDSEAMREPENSTDEHTLGRADLITLIVVVALVVAISALLLIILF
ncbi:MAG TPA: hypothetical protein VM450_01715 [Thermomicrobiales bacterium]|nr:hypothetical protein [Thermomicrobiales bacterium]